MTVASPRTALMRRGIWLAAALVLLLATSSIPTASADVLPTHFESIGASVRLAPAESGELMFGEPMGNGEDQSPFLLPGGTFSGPEHWTAPARLPGTFDVSDARGAIYVSGAIGQVEINAFVHFGEGDRRLMAQAAAQLTGSPSPVVFDSSLGDSWEFGEDERVGFSWEVTRASGVGTITVHRGFEHPTGFRADLFGSSVTPVWIHEFEGRPDAERYTNATLRSLVSAPFGIHQVSHGQTGVQYWIEDHDGEQARFVEALPAEGEDDRDAIILMEALVPEVWPEGTVQLHMCDSGGSGTPGQRCYTTAQQPFWEAAFGASATGLLPDGWTTALQWLTLLVVALTAAALVPGFRRLSASGSTQARDNLIWLIAGAAALKAVIDGLTLYTTFRFHVEDLGGKPWQVSLFMGVGVMGFGVGYVLWGYLADRYGHRRRLLVGTTVVAALLMLPMPLMTAWWAFTALVGLQMVIAGSFRIPWAIVTEAYGHLRGEALGVLFGFVWLGGVTASIIAGELLISVGFGAVVAVGFVLYLLAALAFSRLIGEDHDPPPVERPTRVAEEVPGPEGGWGWMPSAVRFRSPWPWWVLVIIFLISVPRGAIVLNALTYFDRLGFDLDFISLVEAWALAAGSLLVLFVGRWCDSLGAERVFLWSAWGYLALWGTFSLAVLPFVSVLIYIIPVWPFLFASADALMARHTELDERNRAMGLSHAMILIGMFVGSLLAAALLAALEGSGMSEQAQYLWSFRPTVLLLVVSVVLAAWLRRRLSIDPDDHPMEAELWPPEEAPVAA